MLIINLISRFAISNIEPLSYRVANFRCGEFINCKVPEALMYGVKDGAVRVATLVLKYSMFRFPNCNVFILGEI